MLVGPLRLSFLAGVSAFGAIGAVLALVGLGLPFVLAALLAATAAGLVQFAAQRLAPLHPATAAPPRAEEELRMELGAYRAHTAALRHDLRGVLSPALMVSDRLLNHADPAVQRAGTAVVRSIERATALLANSKDSMQPGTPGQASAAADQAANPARLMQ